MAAGIVALINIAKPIITVQNFTFLFSFFTQAFYHEVKYVRCYSRESMRGIGES